MKVAHVCDYATARVFKELAILNGIYDVMLFYRQCFHRDLLEQVDKVSTWTKNRQLFDKMQRFNPDIVHIHTSISSEKLIDMVLAFDLSCKIVWDCHDLTANVSAIDKVDSIIVPCQGYKTQLNNRKSIVVYSKAPKTWIDAAVKESLNTLNVNAFCLVSEVNNNIVWRDYREVQSKLFLPMFVFPANISGWEDHSNVMQRLPYLKMLAAMRSFRYGWAGEPNSKSDFSGIVTNKFWEYAGMGLDVGLWKIGEMTEIAERFGWKVKHYGEFRFYKTKESESVFMDSEIEKIKEVYK